MRYLVARGFRELLSHKKEVGNTVTLFSSQILVLIIGLGIKSIQVRVLTPEDYGLFALFGTITSFIVLFFHYASFSSLKVLLANNEDNQREKEFFGIGIIIAIILGFLFSFCLIVASYFVDNLLNVEIGEIIKLLAPFCIILPFQFLISEITIGAGKLKGLAFFHLFSKILFVISLFVLWKSDLFNLNVKAIIFINLLSWFIATVFVLLGLNPSFKNLKKNYKLVTTKNKSFGFSYYFGAIVNQSTYKLDELFISYFVNITQLGYYTLASIICSPMTFLSRAFVNSILKKLALKDRIPIRVFVYNTFWLCICVLFLYLFSDIIVSTLFGNSYMEISKYILPLSLAFFFQGMYAPFSFLTIKSKGKQLRNVAYAEAIVNVIGNILLVPTFFVLGAIFASILARFTHFIGLFYYYRKIIKE